MTDSLVAQLQSLQHELLNGWMNPWAAAQEIPKLLALAEREAQARAQQPDLLHTIVMRYCADTMSMEACRTMEGEILAVSADAGVTPPADQK